MNNNEVFINCCVNDNYLVSSLGRLKNKKTNKFLDGYTPQTGYLRFKLNNIYYTASRIIYKSFNLNENIEGFDIDHIDQDKSNNKLNNLRKCTREENTGNQSHRTTNKLNIKNIHQYEKRGKNIYRVEIRRAKDNIKICKEFLTLGEALLYRNEKIFEIWGIYARL